MSSQPKPLRAGQIVRLRISALAPGGEGISKDYGIPVFVGRVAPGDIVDVNLYDVRKQFAKGHVVELIEPSVWRAEPPCPIFKVCGGCQWQHMGYHHQLEAKTDIVKQAIKHIGKINDELVQPTIAAVSPLSYRNKAQFPVGSVASTGRILAGYYKQNSHELVNIKHCPVQPEPMDRAIETAKEILQRFNVTAYEEKTGRGLLRHIAERYSFDRNQILLTIVLNLNPTLSGELRAKFQNVSTELMETVPEIVGVCVNYNPAKGNRIMGDTTECIAGEAHLIEKLQSNLPTAPEKLRAGLEFRLSSTSFFQINSLQATRLLDEVLSAATSNLTEKIPLLIDAYAGVGTIGMWLASVCDRVIAIEEMASSVADGKVNLELNQVQNFEFHLQKVEDYVPVLLSQNLRPNVVVVDPPRKGVHPEGLKSIVELGPERIVYVSCNPATLARDLRILEDSGYKTKRVQPIDMFPQTYHVESVTTIEKSAI